MMASLQSAQILHQISLKVPQLQDRFYKSVYEFLLDIRISSFSKPNLLLNVLYKIVKADSNEARIFAFVKRILQVSASLSPSFACAVLVLVSEIIRHHPNVGYLIEKFPESRKKHKNREESPADASLYDPAKRDPQFCGAKSSMAFELVVDFNAVHFRFLLSSFRQEIRPGHF
jgi:ribosome biogenesis protein MAK21